MEQKAQFSIAQQIGPARLARLLAGLPADGLETGEPDPEAALWAGLAAQVGSLAGTPERIERFEALIASRPDADSLRAAVMGVDLDAEFSHSQSDGRLFPATHASAEAPGAVPVGPERPDWARLPDWPELPRSARLPDVLREEAAGAGRWLNTYVEFACRASPMSPKIFHQALGLALLATAIARRVALPAGNQLIYPNTYTLIVAHSTLYAKTTALELASDLLARAGLEFLMLPVGMTPQSLISELSNRQPETFSEWEPGDQEDWRRERRFAAQRLWLMDEVGSLLDSFERKYLSELLTHVLKLYDCPDRLTAASTIGSGRQSIRCAYLTICGPTTPAALRPHLRNPAYWGNGLFARFALITPDAPPKRFFYPDQVEPPDTLAAALRVLALERLAPPGPDRETASGPDRETASGPDRETASGPIMARLAPGVWERWDAYHGGLWGLVQSGAAPERLHASYGRFHNLAMKTALQLAAADWAEGQPGEALVVQQAHWARGQEYAESARASLHRLLAQYGHSEEEGLDRRILAVLEQNAGPLSGREVAIAMGMTGAGERTALERGLERLRQQGVLTQVERRGERGPAARAWKKAAVQVIQAEEC